MHLSDKFSLNLNIRDFTGMNTGPARASAGWHCLSLNKSGLCERLHDSDAAFTIQRAGSPRQDRRPNDRLLPAESLCFCELCSHVTLKRGPSGELLIHALTLGDIVFPSIQLKVALASHGMMSLCSCDDPFLSWVSNHQKGNPNCERRRHLNLNTPLKWSNTLPQFWLEASPRWGILCC